LLLFLLVNLLIKSYGNNDNFNDLAQYKEKLRQQVQRDKYKSVKCESIFELNKDEIDKAKVLLKNLRHENKLKRGTEDIPLLPDSNFIFDKSRCALFRDVREYDKHVVTRIEKEFPLAFTILTNENAEQFERFLRLIYRPHNVYCVHVDAKSSPEFVQAVRSIVRCFPNVFITSRLERVVYASFTRLQADLNCMNDLLHLDDDVYLHEKLGLVNQESVRQMKELSKWKYVLNTASSEFPLRTNLELVKILHMYNGTNEVEINDFVWFFRINPKWKIVKTFGENEELQRTNETNLPPPHGFVLKKGYAYVALSRPFVQYAFQNNKARDFIEWTRHTYSPDETVWATLQFNTQFNPPGGFKDPKKKRIDTLARFSGWVDEYDCKGMWRHAVCLFSIEDLSKIFRLPHFILNKFWLSFDPISYQCMEELYEYKQTKSNRFFDLQFYCSYIQNHSTLSLCSNS
jgi:hypothetical protein